MGFSALLQPGSCFGAFGGAERFSSSGSTLPGRAVWQPARFNVDKRFAGAAARNELGGEEKREEKNKLLGVASVSIGFNAILLMSVTRPAVPVSHKESPFGWLSLPLLAVWGAILLNAFVQYGILERLTWLPQPRESTGRVDFTLKQRVADLEENVREFVTTARGLSKQVEKLGVRFRATKRSLRDPMQDTAVYARKASEVTTILAQREDRLEEELRGLQCALLAMQEHQVKQLALISLALKRTQNEGKQQLASPVNGSGSVLKTPSDAHARAARDVETSTDSVAKTSNYRRRFTKGAGGEPEVPTADPRVEPSVNGTSQRSDTAPKSSTFSSEGSLSKVDFWKESVVPSAVVDKMTVDESSGAASDRGDGPDRSKLGSFFNGRKRTATPSSAPLEDVPLNADVRRLESEALPQPEDASNYVEQPDYDSDSWLR